MGECPRQFDAVAEVHGLVGKVDAGEPSNRDDLSSDLARQHRVNHYSGDLHDIIFCLALCGEYGHTMFGNRHETPGQRLDRILFTRPLFETLLFENELVGPDRITVIAHTLRAVIRYRAGQLGSGAGEVIDTLVFRILAKGRVPPTGMTAILRVGDFVWYQVTQWGVAQRVRRAFGRVSRRNDCTALYCGWRHHAPRGEPLPMFVLLDATSRVMEVAYADVGVDGVESLSPGIGIDLRPSHAQVVPALQGLALQLGVANFDEQLYWFTGL